MTSGMRRWQRRMCLRKSVVKCPVSIVEQVVEQDTLEREQMRAAVSGAGDSGNRSAVTSGSGQFGLLRRHRAESSSAASGRETPLTAAVGAAATAAASWSARAGSVQQQPPPLLGGAFASPVPASRHSSVAAQYGSGEEVSPVMAGGAYGRRLEALMSQGRGGVQPYEALGEYPSGDVGQGEYDAEELGTAGTDDDDDDDDDDDNGQDMGQGQSHRALGVGRADA